MKQFIVFLMLVTVLTFLTVGLVLLLLGQSVAWYQLALASLANGFLTGFVLKKV